jgi:hypothetical protein
VSIFYQGFGDGFDMMTYKSYYTKRLPFLCLLTATPLISGLSHFETMFRRLFDYCLQKGENG